jgi:hypothetical protein
MIVNSNFWLDEPRSRIVGSDQRDMRVSSELVRHLTPIVMNGFRLPELPAGFKAEIRSSDDLSRR